VVNVGFAREHASRKTANVAVWAVQHFGLAPSQVLLSTELSSGGFCNRVTGRVEPVNGRTWGFYSSDSSSLRRPRVL